MTVRREPPPLSPGAKRFVRGLGVFTGGSLLTAVILGGAAAKAFAAFVGSYWLARAISWAVRSDYRASHSRRVDAFDPEKQLDKEFLREWKKIEDDATRERNREIAREAARKKKPRIVDERGNTMMCIMGCGHQVNERGRFCDLHDDDNPLYDKP